MPIQPGVYRHYKGRYYLVLGEAQHSETNEALVVYQPLYGESKWFVRPKAMFLELVQQPNDSRPRFEYLGPEQPETV